MKRFAMTLLAALALLACPPSKTPPAPDFEPQDAAAQDETEGGDAAGWDDCTRACMRARKVQCRTGYSVDGGATCTATCRHVRDTHLTVLDIGCMQSATTLEIARTCTGWGC